MLILQYFQKGWWKGRRTGPPQPWRTSGVRNTDGNWEGIHSQDWGIFHFCTNCISFHLSQILYTQYCTVTSTVHVRKFPLCMSYNTKYHPLSRPGGGVWDSSQMDGGLYSEGGERRSIANSRSQARGCATPCKLLWNYTCECLCVAGLIFVAPKMALDTVL